MSNISSHLEAIRSNVPELWEIRHNARYTTDTLYQTDGRLHATLSEQFPTAYAIVVYCRWVIGLCIALPIVMLAVGMDINKYVYILYTSLTVTGSAGFLAYIKKANSGKLALLLEEKQDREASRHRWHRLYTDCEDVRLKWRHDYLRRQKTCDPDDQIKQMMSQYNKTFALSKKTDDDDFKTAESKLDASWLQNDKQSAFRTFGVRVKGYTGD